MSEKHTTKRSLSDIGTGKTDWARFDGTTESDIERQIAEDAHTAPDLNAEWFAKAKVVSPNKQAINIRLDTEVLDYFRQSGNRYQTMINQVLRAYVDAHKKSA